MTRVKVCCISSLEEAELSISLGASALGLVGPMPTGPGVIDLELAARIARSRPPGVSTFLLTSGDDAEEIAEEVLWVGSDAVQLVRHLEPRVHRALRKQLPSAVRLVQVVHVEDSSSLAYARQVSGGVDALLLDSGRPQEDILGGTGGTHDWSLSRSIVEAVDVPVWLAGGLNASNIRDAITRVDPFGVDVCSGVRTDGKLDAARLRSFVRGAKSG